MLEHGSLQELLEYLGQEQACYTALLDLSGRQRQALEIGSFDELLDIQSAKQELLGRVRAIESQIAPFKRQWASLRASLDDDDRQVLGLALATVEELLCELIALEKRSEALLLEGNSARPKRSTSNRSPAPTR